MTRKQIIAFNVVLIVVWYGLIGATGAGSYRVIVISLALFSIPQVLVNVLLTTLAAVQWFLEKDHKDRAAKRHLAITFAHSSWITVVLTVVGFWLSLVTGHGPGFLPSGFHAHI